MPFFLTSVLAFTVVCLVQLSRAQQYAGDVIPNSLPGVPGSEITYFRIVDPKGKSDHLTLTNYYSHQANGQQVDPSKLRRAIIVIHGLNRDPGTYMSNVSHHPLSQAT